MNFGEYRGDIHGPPYIFCLLLNFLLFLLMIGACTISKRGIGNCVTDNATGIADNATGIADNATKVIPC